MKRITAHSRVVVAALVAVLTLLNASSGRAQTSAPTILVYHQITNLTGGTGSVGYPVLSADGTRGVFADAPGTEDEATPNRIFVVGADGQGMTEVDAYKTWCYCGSWVAISADGETVVSTESMQLRLVQVGGSATTLVGLSSNELSSLRITAAGDRVFFILGRDTALAESTDTLQRGIYVVNADGSGLQQVTGPDEIGDLLGVTPDTVGMARLAAQGLDVSDDGAHLIFTAYIGAEMAVLAVDGDGSNLHQLAGPLTYAMRVGISADGATVVYDVDPLNDNSQHNEITVADYTGGTAQVLTTTIASVGDEPLRLSADGSQLLISPNSLLVDTATGAMRQLAQSITNLGGNHLAVLTDGLPRATMNADATRFLYAMRVSRCADCANAHEQMATLDIDPTDLGAAPIVVEPSVSPDAIPLNYVSATTVQADISTTEKLLGVNLIALRDGVFDVNVGRDVLLVDDGTNGDATAGDGTFTNNNVVHVGYVGREDDTGPRMLRVQAEVETADGFRHATAVEFGPVTVEAA